MKRFHVHVNVADLAASVAFYRRLFGADPVRLEADYAKWMLEDPRLNFAISTRGGEPGVDHLGFQADDDAELATLREHAAAADAPVLEEGLTSCCYARSDKHWVTDPQGIAWEQFRTLENIPVFREAAAPVPDATAASADAAACCAPRSPRGKPVGIAVRAEGGTCC